MGVGGAGTGLYRNTWAGGCFANCSDSRVVNGAVGAGIGAALETRGHSKRSGVAVGSQFMHAAVLLTSKTSGLVNASHDSMVCTRDPECSLTVCWRPNGTPLEVTNEAESSL